MTTQRSVDVVTLAGGIGHPEGPDILPDGRIVMVETYTGKIIAWSAERGLHDYLVCDGGPNACTVGSDGAVYITQNGGTAGAWKAEVMSTPSIQRGWPDGTVEVVVASVDGVDLQAPNDLCFGPDGCLYFTDPSDYTPEDPGDGRLAMIRPDGTSEILEVLPGTYPNGIVAEPDGAIVFVDSYRSGVYRWRRGASSEQIAQLPDGHIPDGLKIDIDGNLWITTYTGGGIDVVSPDGDLIESLITGGCPLNCTFDGRTLLITDLGDVEGVDASAFMGGRLWRVDVDVEGAERYRGAIR